MIEIEVKAKLKEPDKILHKLESMGCIFSEKITQEDYIYLSQGIRFADITAGVNILRLRKENGTVRFTIKQHRKNELDCIENEVIVSDFNKMGAMLAMMGYYEVVRYRKQRMTGKYADYTICIDKVDKLGDFIEVECMSSVKIDGAQVQKELFAFLSELGIQAEDRILLGYPTMTVNLEQGA